MKITPTLIHAASDYALASLLLFGPWIFGFSTDGVATAWTMSFGAILLGYSLFTDYEPSIRRVIPVAAHIALDGLFGGLLIGAPFMFGFSGTTWIPHLVIGCVWTGIAARVGALSRVSPSPGNAATSPGPIGALSVDRRRRGSGKRPAVAESC